MLDTDSIPQNLLAAIKRARQIRQLDSDYSNGVTAWSPTWDRLSELTSGVEDDPQVRWLIQHYRETDGIP